jgi:hypothetical protein
MSYKPFLHGGIHDFHFQALYTTLRLADLNYIFFRLLFYIDSCSDSRKRCVLLINNYELICVDYPGN